MRQLLPGMVLLALLAACGRPTQQPAVTLPAPVEKSMFPATEAELRAMLGSAAIGLPSTNLTLRFEDISGNERLKTHLHELISARSPDGIHHWSWRSDAGSELNALIIHQGHVTWHRLTNEGRRSHEWLVHGVLRSEIVDMGSPQVRSTALRMHLSNGTTQDVYYCVSVGA